MKEITQKALDLAKKKGQTIDRDNDYYIKIEQLNEIND